VPLWITYHPSAVLRADDRAAEIRGAIVDDLRAVAAWLQR
jgi:uracil-DNA glycosylase